ncbi:MAG: TldD/PmbA family protein [Candidatus Bathyarchaeia archaeon]
MERVDLVTPVEKAIRILSRLDIDFYDVVASYSRSLSVNIMGKGVKEASAQIDVGIGVRVFKNKGMGVAYSQSLEDADVEAIVNQAVSFAKVSQPDPYFKSIPGPSKAPEVPDLCDEEIVNLTLEDAGRMPKGMIDAAESVRSGAMYWGGFGANYSRGCLMTSTGVSVESEKTSTSAYLQPVYREGDDVGSSYEFDLAISLSEIDFYKVGKKAAEKAIEQFGSRKEESGSLPLILSPESSSSLFSALLSALSGESAVKGRTFASGLLGKQISPEILEIGDNGTIPGAIASSTYDGEGVPRKPLNVINRGRVSTFLHNSYSAGIMNIESTGHAIRGGYRGQVGAGPSNIKVKPGDSSLEEMISETKRGILVINASFPPNMVSGEFSTTIDEGFLIENGEKRHPVKNLMAGGHIIIDLYRNIELISKEGRTIGKGFFFPWVKIKQVKLSGK